MCIRDSIVVRQEHHLEHATNRQVVIDHARNAMDELDDQLGLIIVCRGLAGEDFYARNEVPRGMRANVVIKRYRLEDIEKLALILVESFDLDVEQGVRINLDEQSVGNEP